MIRNSIDEHVCGLCGESDALHDCVAKWTPTEVDGSSCCPIKWIYGLDQSDIFVIGARLLKGKGDGQIFPLNVDAGNLQAMKVSSGRGGFRMSTDSI